MTLITITHYQATWH